MEQCILKGSYVQDGPVVIEWDYVIGARIHLRGRKKNECDNNKPTNHTTPRCSPKQTSQSASKRCHADA